MKKRNSNKENRFDLLKNRQFLLWRMLPTKELDVYWREKQLNDPHLIEKINNADSYLKTYLHEEQRLTNEEKVRLLNHIIQSVSKKQKKSFRSISWIKYAAAACIILLVTAGLFLYIRDRVQNVPAHLVIGNALHPKDIQLITGETAVRFDKNIEIQIDEGVAKVNKENDEEASFKIAKNSLNKLLTPYGKRSQIKLSDGTKIWLNSGSSLEFPSAFSANKREVWLTGEMYIDVAGDKKRPFYVHTKDFFVQVHGTEFNVSTATNSEKQSSVVLVEGNVALYAENAEGLRLAPNEKGVYSIVDGFSKARVNTGEYISWKNGYLTLNAETIDNVLKKIGKYYNVAFKFDKEIDFRHITCTGKIDLAENIDDVMKTIAVLSDTTYKRDGNTISIISKK